MSPEMLIKTVLEMKIPLIAIRINETSKKKFIIQQILLLTGSFLSVSLREIFFIQNSLISYE